MRQPSSESIRKAGIALLFTAALFVPLVQGMTHLFPEPVLPETKHGTQSSESYEKTYAKSFPLRAWLVLFNNRLRLSLGSPVASVLAGKEGWLFYVSEASKDGETFTDTQGVTVLTDEELLKIRNRLDSLRLKFGERGIPFVVALVPNKNTVYPEFLPDTLSPRAQPTRMDRVAEALNGDGEERVLDLRTNLLKAKQQMPIYSKTDSHWNDYGAYIGYAEMMRRFVRLKPDFAPTVVEPAPIPEFGPSKPGDLARMTGMPWLFSDPSVTIHLAEKNSSEESKPMLLVYHDSFIEQIEHFLARDFKLHKLPLGHVQEMEMDSSDVQAVLILIAERYLAQLRDL